MRPFLLVGLGFLLIGRGVLPQCSASTSQPDPGSVSGNVYTNQFFGITLEIQKDWVVVEPSGHTETAASHTPPALLLLTPAGTQSGEAVALTAQDFRNSPGFDFHFMDELRPLMEKQGWQSLKNHGYYTLGGGVPAHREDFRSNDAPPRYAAVLAGPLKGFEMKFLVQAGSPQRVEDLVKQVLAVKIQPDWRAPDRAAVRTPDLHDVPDSQPKRVRVSAQVLQSLAKKRGLPVYPTESRQNHVQGSVVMNVHVDQSGHIEDIYVEEGDPLLARAAVEAVSHWEYQPYLLNGIPATLESMVVVNFQLH